MIALGPAALLLCGLLLCLAPIPPLFAQQLLDGVAAIVGEKIILKSDVVQLAQMTALNDRVDLSLQPQLLSRYESRAIQALVTQNILLARAKVESLDVIKDSEVDQTLEMQVSNMLNQAGSEEELETLLGQPLREFRLDYWYDIRDRLISDRYQQQKISRVKITRPEVESFYATYEDSLPLADTQVDFSHLIVPIRPGTGADQVALQRITDILARLKAGEDFAHLAKQHSADPASSELGGDLGFVRRGSLVREFERVAFQLEHGELSDVVKTEFGYHIIQLLNRQGEKINVRHILIASRATPEDRQNALTAIRDYFYRLEADPALFDSLADSLSSLDDPVPGLGYVGWVELSALPHDKYRLALQGVKPGQVAPPFESTEGFHILKLLNLKPGGKPTLADHYPQIEAFALRRKQGLYFQQWLSTVRKEVFINILE